MNSKAATYERYGNFIINRSEQLGSGNFGHVWKGYLISQGGTLQPVAIKQSYNQTQNIQEIQALQILKHPNIIRYRDYRISGNQVFMVMQLCQGGTLDDLLYSMQVHDTQKIISLYSQIISGIKFMYENKILHRDIKPSNLLVTKNKIIKIADFGTSKMNKSSELLLKTLVGTPLFFSPQLLKMSLGQQDTYSQKSQIWALGLILYYMFNYQYNIVKPAERMKQSLPWTGRNTLQILRNIINQPLIFKKPQLIPEQIKNIIIKMLKLDVQQRMSFKELFSIQLFNKNNYGQMYYLTQNQQVSEEKTINQIKRQTIDWKDQQSSNNQQLQQFRAFYELLIQELAYIYQSQYYDFMFQLQFQNYQLTDKVQEKIKIKEKYKEKQNIFKQVQQKKFNESSNLNFGQNPSLAFNKGKDSQNFNLIGTLNSQTLILPLPSQKLVLQSKSFIHKNLNKVINIKGVKNCDNFSKNMINFIYDLFTLLTLQKSWQIKKKTKATIQNYKKMRSLVKIDTLIQRITKASQTIKL